MPCPAPAPALARRDHSSHRAMLHSHEIVRPSKLCTLQQSSNYLRLSACWYATCVPESLDIRLIGHQTRTSLTQQTHPQSHDVTKSISPGYELEPPK